MNVGFGTTALAKGLSNNYVDGIGVSCSALLREYKNIDDVTISPISFNENSGGIIQDERTYAGSFSLNAIFSLFTSRQFMYGNSISSGIDLFHAPDHYIPKLKNTPVVATVMDMIPFAHPEWASKRLRKIKNLAFKGTMHWPERIITISEHSKEDIVYYLDIDDAKVSVVPLGFNASYKKTVDENIRISVRKKYGLSKNYFLFVGTLQPRKNIKRIIQAHNILPDYIRREYPLVIVGKKGWGSDSVINNINRLEEKGYGKWLNFICSEDLQSLLQSATALVYPSLYEGFGLPILEGFAARIPVITSSTTSIPEVAGDAALLVNPYDIEEIAYAMSKVAEDSSLAGKLIEKGINRLEKFSWQRCARETIDVYRTLV